MLTARNATSGTRRSRLPRVRSIVRSVRRALDLCRALGPVRGLIVAAQLPGRHESVRFPDNGHWYRIRHEPNVASHIINSTSKLRRLAEVVTPEDRVIVDLGAHSGLFTVFAKERSPQALAILAEPDPTMRPIIEQNLASHTRWRLIQKAVSSESGVSSFYRNLGATQASSLFEDSAHAFAGEVQRVDIEVTTLDDIAQDIEAADIDVLKLDVQGAERLVFAGATASLPRVRKLIVEVTFLDPDPGELLTFLAGEFGAPETLNPVFMGADLLYRRADHG